MEVHKQARSSKSLARVADQSRCRGRGRARYFCVHNVERIANSLRASRTAGLIRWPRGSPMVQKSETKSTGRRNGVVNAIFLIMPRFSLAGPFRGGRGTITPSEFASIRVHPCTRRLSRKTFRLGRVNDSRVLPSAGPTTAKSFSCWATRSSHSANATTHWCRGPRCRPRARFLARLPSPGPLVWSKGDFIQRLNRFCSKPWPILLPPAATSWNSRCSGFIDTRDDTTTSAP